MSSIKIEKLILKNFRSYKDSEVVFPETGLVLIRGKNLDTGGSSYSGKSSIPLALAYALGFCPLSAKEQTNWNSKTKEVTLVFKKDNIRYELTRTDKNTKLIFDGQEISGSKVIEEKIEEVFGVPSEMIKHLTYRQQRTNSYFLSVPDSEKKDFLSKVLGLSKIEEEIEKSTERNKDIEKELDKIDTIVSHQQSMLQSLAFHEPVLVDVSTFEKQIEVLQTQLEDQKSFVDSQKMFLSMDIKKKNLIEQELLHKIDEFKKDWNNDWNNFNEELQKLELEDSALKLAFEDNRRKIQNSYKECLKRSSKLPAMLDSVSQTKKDIELLKQNKCPTCSQNYIETATMIEQKSKELSGFEEQIKVLNEINKKTEELETEIRKLSTFVSNPRIREVSDRINRLELELSNKSLEIQNEYQDNLRGIEISIKTKEIEIKNLESSTKSLINQVSSLKETILFSLQENSRREEEYLTAKQELEKIKQNVYQYGQTRKVLFQELNTNKEMQEFLGKKGFLGSIFDEILIELNTEINEILKGVANTSHVYFEFLSETATTKGETKKQIKPMVTISGNEASLYSGASGGMISAIELAVDIALMNVVSRRSNSNPGWMILDESFDGMDVVSKETCLDMLRKNSANKIVLVIDHATEIKEAFTSFIDVEYKNGVSRVA